MNDHPDGDLLKTIGRKISERRKSLGLAQSDLADAAAMSRSYLAELERGKRNISVIVLLRIARALNVAPAHLIECCDAAAHEPCCTAHR